MNYVILILVAIVLQACGPLFNVENQQTTRINTSASRNPTLTDTDIQGSERSQGKSPVITSDITKDTSGAEK